MTTIAYFAGCAASLLFFGRLSTRFGGCSRRAFGVGGAYAAQQSRESCGTLYCPLAAGHLRQD